MSDYAGEYERWEGRFGVSEYIFGTEPNVFLAAQKARLPKGGRALAVADGEGRNGVWLAEQGLDVLSLERSPRGQAKARELAALRGVTMSFELADLTTWTWPLEAFDVIAVIFTQFLGSDDLEKYFADLRSALKPGGLLLMEGYSPKQLEYGTGGPKTLDGMYTRDLLERAFAGMSELTIEEYDAERHEGSGHGGMSGLIDLIGRK